MLGYLLRLGEHVLEVPISAMLILSLPTGLNATDRVLETLIGAATGLVAGLVLSPLHVQPAEEAIEELAGDMTGLLAEMAEGVRRDEPHAEAAAGSTAPVPSAARSAGWSARWARPRRASG